MTDFTEQTREWLQERTCICGTCLELDLPAALTAAYEQGLEDAEGAVRNACGFKTGTPDKLGYTCESCGKYRYAIRALKETTDD